MNNLLSEHLFPLNEAADHIPTEPSISTVRRWCRVGLRGIKLESMMLAGKRVTSRQALLRFFAALDAPNEAPQQPHLFQRPRPAATQSINQQFMQLGLHDPRSHRSPGTSSNPGQPPVDAFGNRNVD